MDEKGLCPRLIDFVVLVGRRANSRLQPHGAPYYRVGSESLKRQSTTAGGVSNPELLRRYPSENHKDFELPTDVTYFCQPEGCITIGSSQRRWQAFRDTTSFVFTLTEKDSAKIRYGVSLNFFLNYERRATGASRTAADGEPAPTRSPTRRTADAKSKKRTSNTATSLTTLCLISHHPFVSIFRDVLILLRQLIDSCNHRCNADESLPRDAVWSVLMGHWSHQRGAIPPPIMDEIRQIETWILTLLSSPVPVPGKTKVVIEVLPLDIMPMMEFALPDHTRFSLVDFPLHLPLELLGVEAVTRLLAAIMLEYKVVLQSRNYNAVSMCVLALVALLYPLEYMFPVIPLLPLFMPSAEQLLLAPTPFIIGVPAAFFYVKNITCPMDVVLIDLDTNELTIPPDIDIPLFPEPEATILKDSFRKALGKMGAATHANLVADDSIGNLSAVSSHSSLHHPMSMSAQQQSPSDAVRPNAANTAGVSNADGGAMRSSEAGGYAVDGDEIDIAARVAMVKFFNSPNIFANFSEHSRTLRLYPRPVVALQTESFLRSRPVQSEFITELCRTQSVEYFAECSLCPKNETYARIHTGITSPSQIGDKAKWFTDQLMPIHFNAYPNRSTLADGLAKMRAEKPNNLLSDSDDEDTSDLESSYSGGAMEESVYSDSSFDGRSPSSYEKYKPLSEVADVYNAPKHLKLPQSESALSMDSSISSGRSSPESSMSTSAMDSEADFVRLAENLALKSDSKGDFKFDHSAANDDETRSGSDGGVAGGGGTGSVPMSPLHSATGQHKQKRASLSSPLSGTPTLKTAPLKGLQSLADSASSVGSGSGGGSGADKKQQLMGALNGYAEKSQGMLSQVFRKTAPKAQALHDKAMRPLAEAAANRMEHGQHLMMQKAAANSKAQGSQNNSTAAATQQRKNQQMVVEACEQVLMGQSIGVFTFPKIKRLLEDENLRELACSKLNLGLERRYAEDDFAEDVQLSKAQYKGYMKMLQACVSGLEQSFSTPGSSGLASMFHVLEISYTHFWSENEPQTPGSGVMSLTNTPSGSYHNLSGAAAAQQPPPPAALQPQPEPTMAQQTSPLNNGGVTNKPTVEQPPTNSVNLPPPTVPPPPPQKCSAETAPSVLPPPALPPPPLPQRPPPTIPPRSGCGSSSKQPKAAAVEVPLPKRPPPPLLIGGSATCSSIPTRPAADAPQPPHSNSGGVMEDAVTPKVYGNGGLPISSAGGSNGQLHHPLRSSSGGPPPPVAAPLPPVSAINTLAASAATASNGPLPSSSRSAGGSVRLTGGGEALLNPPESSAYSPPPVRHYIYTDLLAAAKTELWQNFIFWENAFFDMVSQERDIIGMDQDPSDMIDRYAGLNETEKKRLELEEDRILATLLHNLTAYMVMCQAPTRLIQQKVRRLLGKAHIGLIYSKKINQLLDDLQMMQGSRIPLKILGSRLMQKHSFAVHNGSAEGALLFMEVCDDALILRDMTGVIVERWWYERLVNMTYSPKTRMLCLWRRHDDQVYMHKFYTKKCRQLYNCMKMAMERAAARGKVAVAGRDLGGEFPVHDIEHNEGGLLQVRIDGIALLFANRQEFVELSNIKKCNTFGGNIFVLEELNRERNHLVQRRYISTMARDIAWSLHRVFSVKLALDECERREALDEQGVVMRRTGYPSEYRVILPLKPPPLLPADVGENAAPFPTDEENNNNNTESDGTGAFEVDDDILDDCLLTAEREPDLSDVHGRPILLPMTL